MEMLDSFRGFCCRTSLFGAESKHFGDRKIPFKMQQAAVKDSILQLAVFFLQHTSATCVESSCVWQFRCGTGSPVWYWHTHLLSSCCFFSLVSLNLYILVSVSIECTFFTHLEFLFNSCKSVSHMMLCHQEFAYFWPTVYRLCIEAVRLHLKFALCLVWIQVRSFPFPFQRFEIKVKLWKCMPTTSLNFGVKARFWFG